MALDGVFLSHLRREIIGAAVNSRVDKIYQPTRDEIVMSLRSRGFSKKLMINIGGEGPRINFTDIAYENPAQPPMFCMLLRKRLSGARLTGIGQPGAERMIKLEFDAVNEMGDRVNMFVIVELLGRQSNLILCENDRIVDALHRVDAETAKRLILPGARYEPPPDTGKLEPVADNADAIFKAVTEGDGDLSGRILSAVQGVSPVVCREVAFIAARDTKIHISGLDDAFAARLRLAIGRLCDAAWQGSPTMVMDRSGKPLDFSFMPLTQYGTAAVTREYASYSELLDDFYRERDRIAHMRRRSQDLLKLLSSLTERCARKLEKQRAELAQSADREQLRVFGELLKANLHAVPRGASFCEVQNYYDPECGTVRIPLDSALSPSQNAQKYFKDYRRAHNAEQMLTGLIRDGENELQYLESVFDALSRAQSESELAEIRAELADGGYIKTQRDSRKRPQKPLPPLRFRSDDGFDIYVGRNNRQNDELTLRMAEKSDIWLHTKGIHGSHTVISARGLRVPERTIMQAAMLAAYHSKARESGGVPVDYVAVKMVKKPNGAKPGMVIYNGYETVYVTPDSAEVRRLSEKEN